jgi:hypothetical protein
MVARRMSGTGKVGITARALLRRINRRLEEHGEVLKKNHPHPTDRGAWRISGVGEFYVIDLEKGRITRRDVDLERLGREVGALAPYESFDRKGA